MGIRGDEHREGYISKRENIQTLFPFRKNIWSEDVIKLAVKERLDVLKEGLAQQLEGPALEKAHSLADAPLGMTFSLKQKANSLIDYNTVAFNHAVHHVLKDTDYPVGKLDDFPLLNNAENLVIDDIYRILEETGVGIPAYYLPAKYTVDIDGKEVEGTYARSRSGCFFCFYQQKIEWVWLLEQHPDLFALAKGYEKDGLHLVRRILDRPRKTRTRRPNQARPLDPLPAQQRQGRRFLEGSSHASRRPRLHQLLHLITGEALPKTTEPRMNV